MSDNAKLAIFVAANVWTFSSYWSSLEKIDSFVIPDDDLSACLAHFVIPPKALLLACYLPSAYFVFQEHALREKGIIGQFAGLVAFSQLGAVVLFDIKVPEAHQTEPGSTLRRLVRPAVVVFSLALAVSTAR